MTEDQLDEIGQLAESLDSSLFAYQNMPNLSPGIHLKGLSSAITVAINILLDIYKNNGGDVEDLDIQSIEG